MASKDTRGTAEAQAFAQRLRQALQDAGVPPSPTVIANEFNLRYWGRSISIHAARNWLLGVSLPRPDKLRVLADWLRVAPAALLLGAPDAIRTLHKSERHASDAQGKGAALAHGRLPDAWSMAEQHMLDTYLRLSKESQHTVQTVVAACAALEAARTRTPTAQAHSPHLPAQAAQPADQDPSGSVVPPAPGR